ncbi:hypothetical protein GCM10009809_41870 [Isoptericola hypogeus]|uniref:Bacterial transcriptional activator domain-containing protein n=1 Tax=Isoptericola hypogeus TaxID=300179 RepID=A0ABN2JX67_9MICO
MNELRVTMLGPFDLSAHGGGAGGSVEPLVRKAQYLLALVLLAPGRTLRRDLAAATLWPEAGPDTSRRAIRQALWRLHQATDGPERAGGRLLVADGDVIHVNPDRPLWIDTVTLTRAAREAETGAPADERVLRRLARAAELYRGPFLESCHDEWCLAYRARLEDRCLTLLDALSHGYERLGDGAAATAWAHRLLDVEPAHERSHRRLMRLYYDGGDRTRALRQLAECRLVLRRELDVTPSAQTEALGAAIRADRGSVTRPPDGDRVLAERALGGTEPLAGPLEGFRSELAALRASIEAIGARLGR